MEIWSDNAGVPGKLVRTSLNSHLKAVVLPQDSHSYFQLGFEFVDLPVRAGAKFHAVLRFAGYTGDADHFIGWRHSFPDPQYREGVTFQWEKMGKFPLELSILEAIG